MVDQGAVRFLGIVVLTLGVVLTLANGKHSRWFANHFRLSRRYPAPTPEQIDTSRRLLFWLNLFGGLLVIAVGIMWILGIG